MKICFGSHNPHKIREAKKILGAQNIILSSIEDLTLSLPEPEETGSDFDANALLKAEYYASHTGLPTLSEDAGLMVDGLEGAPGVRSARFAKELGGYDKAFEKIQSLLEDTNAPLPYTARFVCVLSFVNPHTKEKLFFDGIVNGTLQFAKTYKEGFGYDPIFIPHGYQEPYAALEAAIKEKTSHRRQALEQFIRWIQSQENIQT